MTNEQTDVYHDILRTKLGYSELKVLEGFFSSHCRYNSTILQAVVDILEMQGDYQLAEALAEFVVENFAKIEATSKV